MDGVGPKGMALKGALLCEESTGSHRNGWLNLKGTLYWEKSTGSQTHGYLNLKGTHSHRQLLTNRLVPKAPKGQCNLSEVTVSGLGPGIFSELLGRSDVDPTNMMWISHPCAGKGPLYP